ncbi:hypothetical protein Tco_0861232 [Tanacetum coccineum]|uniref:Uncharacterized protein n=1 Tax=Tanacetum coccineum TaxID=301880 RepID=A0ABQ5BH78_9ASTR
MNMIENNKIKTVKKERIRSYESFRDEDTDESVMNETLDLPFPNIAIIYLLLARMIRSIRLLMQVFGGLVNAGNSDLPSTDLADNNYLLFNLNDYPNGMVTLFNLLVMGSWQVWMKIVAFVLQAFFAQMDLKSFEEKQRCKLQLSPLSRAPFVPSSPHGLKLFVVASKCSFCEPEVADEFEDGLVDKRVKLLDISVARLSLSHQHVLVMRL